MRSFKRAAALMLALALLIALPAFSASGYEWEDEYVYEYCDDLSEGQLNIMKRARQLLDVEWTPVEDRYQWGYAGVFRAGETYKGVPYGQAVHAAYIGYNGSISDFVGAVEDGTSVFYSEYSQYSRIAPYYSIDCSGFVSYAWGLASRKTTQTLPSAAELIEDGTIDDLEPGDCLDNLTSHAVLVGGILRDDDGEVVTVEILEQTPVIARRTVFGEGGTRSLDYFNAYYFGGGYKLYRYPERDWVEYTHDCAVPLGDECDDCRHPAPAISIEADGESMTVYLSSGDCDEIYYTLDGSDPAEHGELYDGPIEVYETALLRAVAYGGELGGSRELRYRVGLEQAAAPECSVAGGTASGGTVSYGSTIALASSTPGAEIYYTLDGSDPADGERYTSPITVTEDVEIRAIARAERYLDSEEAAFSFSVASFSSYDDVSPEAWYAPAVEYVSGRGLFNGTGSGFSPELTMTRGMFVTALGRMAGVPAMTGAIGIVTGDFVNIRSGPGTDYERLGSADSGELAEVLGFEDGWYNVVIDGVEGYIISDYFRAYEGEFSDLDVNAYYGGYVQWAYLTGVVTDAGSFRAGESISREDMAAMLYNYAMSTGRGIPEINARAAFSDDWAISQSCRSAVYALQQGGVINGMGDGSFAPSGSATRAQVAQIFMNFMMKVM